MMHKKERDLDEQEIRFIMDNLNISNRCLGKFLSVSPVVVSRVKNIKCWARETFRCGFSFLRFCDYAGTYRVVRQVGKKMITIGQSSNFEKAVEILDKHLFEVEQGFIKL
jgi:acetyltransferase-like isoleucine patch superfamily enzyme